MALSSRFIHECSEKFTFSLLQDTRSHNSLIFFPFTFYLSLKAIFLLAPLRYILWLFTEVQLLCAKRFSHNVTESICPVHTIEHEALADALSESGYRFSIFHPMKFFLRDFCTCRFNFWQLEIKAPSFLL